jgi:hypothetical protein
MNGNSQTLIRAIRGPIILITIGVLFALDHMSQFTSAGPGRPFSSCSD